jgi:hypothetical protein
MGRLGGERDTGPYRKQGRIGNRTLSEEKVRFAPNARTRFAGLVLGWVRPRTEPSADEASKVGALPQTLPGAEPLDLNT